MMASIQIKKPNGGWGYRAESRKPICRKMATAPVLVSHRWWAWTSAGVPFFFPFLISPEWCEDGFLLSGTTVQSEMVTDQRLGSTSQSSLMNAL